jgi:hypothetical protein
VHCDSLVCGQQTHSISLPAESRCRLLGHSSPTRGRGPPSRPQLPGACGGDPPQGPPRRPLCSSQHRIRTTAAAPCRAPRRLVAEQLPTQSPVRRPRPGGGDRPQNPGSAPRCGRLLRPGAGGPGGARRARGAPQAGAPLPDPPPSPESPRLHRGCTSPPPRPSAPHPRRGIRRGSRRRGVQRLQPFFGNPPSSTSSTQSTASMRLPRLSRLRQRIPAPGTV